MVKEFFIQAHSGDPVYGLIIIRVPIFSLFCIRLCAVENFQALLYHLDVILIEINKISPFEKGYEGGALIS